MVLNSLILLLLSNAITSRRDKSILYSRVTITITLVSAYLSYNSLHLLFLAKGIEIFGGIFHITATTNFFHTFILIISSVILTLTSFYPRKVLLKKYSSPNRHIFTKLIYQGTIWLNKKGEQFKIIEHSLIILFIITGSVFLISTSWCCLLSIFLYIWYFLIILFIVTRSVFLIYIIGLVSIFLFVKVKSYRLHWLSTIYRDLEPEKSGGLMYFLLAGLSSCFILAFIPLWLEWVVHSYIIVILLSLASIFCLLNVYYSQSKLANYDSNCLGMLTDYYISQLEITLSHSAFNDKLLVILIIIGLSMIIIGLIDKENDSVLDKVSVLMDHKQLTLILTLVVFLVILIVNMLLYLSGLGFTVDTSSFTLFVYTFFPKAVIIKLVSVLITCYITKEFKLNYISLSIPGVLLMILTGSLSYFYVLPQIEDVLLLYLTKLESIYTCGLELSKTKITHVKTLAEGLFNSPTK